MPFPFLFPILLKKKIFIFKMYLTGLAALGLRAADPLVGSLIFIVAGGI